MTALIIGVMIFGLILAIVSTLYLTYRDHKRGIIKVMMISVFKNVKKVSKKKIKELAENYCKN